MTIQLGGCALLTEILQITIGPHDVPCVTRDLADYTIATLIANVHRNMDSPALARVCIDTMRTLVHMHSAATGVANPPFLMSGEHSIPGFLMTLMHMIQDDEFWVKQSLGVLLELELVVHARLPQNTAGLLAFNLGQAEEYILDSMAFSSPSHRYADGQSRCMDSLQILYEIFPERVRRPTDVMASVLQILMAHNNNPDVRDGAITLMCTIVEGFWIRTSPLRVLSVTQTRPCVGVIMPLVVCSLRAADAHNPVNKNNCTSVFIMLSLLCRNNPPQIALANKMQIAQLLHYKYHAPIEDVLAHPVVDARCMAAYHHLVEILEGR